MPLLGKEQLNIHFIVERGVENEDKCRCVNVVNKAEHLSVVYFLFGHINIKYVADVVAAGEGVARHEASGDRGARSVDGRERAADGTSQTGQGASCAGR